MNKFFNVSEALSIGVHLCVRLARQPDRFCPTSEVAAEFGFSSHHVAKVVQKLAKAGIVETVRGSRGGARLTRAAADTALSEIAEAIGEPQPEGCLLSREVCEGNRCLLGHFFNEQNQRLASVLRETTLQTVADSLYAQADASPSTPASKPRKAKT